MGVAIATDCVLEPVLAEQGIKRIEMCRGPVEVGLAGRRDARQAMDDKVSIGEREPRPIIGCAIERYHRTPACQRKQMEDPERVPRFRRQRLATLVFGDVERKIGERLHRHHIKRLAQFADRPAAKRAVIGRRLARQNDPGRDLASDRDGNAVPDQVYEV